MGRGQQISRSAGNRSFTGRCAIKSRFWEIIYLCLQHVVCVWETSVTSIIYIYVSESVAHCVSVSSGDIVDHIHDRVARK